MHSSQPTPQKTDFHSLATILSTAALIVEDAGNPFLTDRRDRASALKDALSLINRTKVCINEIILKETALPPPPSKVTSEGRQIRYKNGTFGPVRSIGFNQPRLPFKTIPKKK